MPTCASVDPWVCQMMAPRRHTALVGRHTALVGYVRD